MNLIEILESNIRKNPDKDCLRANGEGYSFRTIKDMADKAAGLFQSMGVEKGDRIAIMSQNTVSFVVAFYGALMAGSVVVPVNHKLVPPEVDYILDHSEAKIFLFDGTLAGRGRQTVGRGKEAGHGFFSSSIRPVRRDGQSGPCMFPC